MQLTDLCRDEEMQQQVYSPTVHVTFRPNAWPSYVTTALALSGLLIMSLPL